MQDLTDALREGTGRALGKRDVALVQEYPRSKAGWSTEHVAGLRLLTFRHHDMWRGTGLAYNPTVWGVVSKGNTLRGVWVHLRHLESSESVWFSTAHFSPGVPQGEYEAEAQDHMQGCPRRAKVIVFQGDLNSGYRWWEDRERVEATGRDGKGELFSRYAMEKGLDFVPFVRAQWNTPTSRPRQAGRTGTQIDYVLCKGLRREPCQIHVDSCYCIGSDHECLSVEFVLKTRRAHRRTDTRPRVWTGGLPSVDGLSQGLVEQYARENTKPKPGLGYRDPREVREAFQKARVSKSNVVWKRALKMRRQARQVWEADRLKRASEADWTALRACRPTKHAGWDAGFSQAQQGDPHDACIGIWRRFTKGETRSRNNTSMAGRLPLLPGRSSVSPLLRLRPIKQREPTLRPVSCW